MTIPQSTIDALPTVLQTLLSPVLISSTPGVSTQILDLVIASPDGTQPVRADLLGLIMALAHADLVASETESLPKMLLDRGSTPGFPAGPFSFAMPNRR